MRSVAPLDVAPQQQQTQELRPVEPAALLNTYHAPRLASPGAILALQRAIGNQAVSQLLQRHAPPRGALQRSATSTATRGGSDSHESHDGTDGLDQQSSEQEQIPIPGLKFGSGKPLASGVRTPLEGLFGESFARVRVHTDSAASTISRAAEARAVTVGDDIYFGEGEYNPHSEKGRTLLAHELTHVSSQAANGQHTNGHQTNGHQTNGHQNGAMQLSRLNGQHPDRDEQDAQAVGEIVGLAGLDGVRAPAGGMPGPAQTSVMRQVHGVVQRAGGKRAAKAKRVGKAIGKGFLMSFVNGVAGPFAWLIPFKRKEKQEEWSEIGNSGPGAAYTNDHLRRMAKAAIVIKEIGSFANWVGLLTGIGSLIAAAFAPFGLAASAILGSIAGIAGLVNMILGVISGGLSTVLLIANLKRAMALPKGSADRKRVMLTVYKDLAGAIGGLIAAASGVVGLSLNSWSPTQTTESISKSLTEGSIGGLTGSWGVQTGANQAFNTGDEMQGGGFGALRNPNAPPPTTAPPPVTTPPTTPPTTTTAPPPTTTPTVPPPTTNPPPVPPRTRTTSTTSGPPSTPPPPIPQTVTRPRAPSSIPPPPSTPPPPLRPTTPPPGVTTTSSTGPSTTPPPRPLGPPPGVTSGSTGPTRLPPPRPLTPPSGVTSGSTGPTRLPPPRPLQQPQVIIPWRIDRVGEEETERPEEEDFSGQVLSELDKVGSEGREVKSIATQDKQQVSTEKSETTSAMEQVNTAGTGLEQMEDAEKVTTSLQEIETKSDAGATDVESDTHGKMTKKDLTESKAQQIKAADAGISEVETKSGEQFGEKAEKKGFFGTLASWLKRGFGAVKKWFVTGFLSIKARLKAMFARMKAKAVKMAIGAMGLTESVEALKESVSEAQGEAPEAESLADQATSETTSAESQTAELETAVTQAKELVGSSTS